MIERKKKAKTSESGQGRGKRGPRDERGVLSDKVLAAARTSFATNGFAGTSLRAVALAAGVDPALVSYYAGTKRDLLEAVLRPPVSYIERVAAAAATPTRTRGAALVRATVESWDDPATAEYLRSVILTAAHEPIAMNRLRDIFATHILHTVATSLDDDERELRAGLVSSHIVGMAMTRYVWKVGSMATLTSDEVVALLAPTIQRYLSGPLPRREGPLTR